MGRANKLRVKSRFKATNRNLQGMRGALVGYLPETTGRQTYENGLTLAQNAAFHELGTRDIPPRDFMRQGAQMFERERPEINNVLRAVTLGSISPDAGSNRLGVMLQRNIQEAFIKGDFAALKPATIARKGSSRPLIDTGKLRQGVDVRTK